MVEKILVYLGAVALAVGLIVGAGHYADASRERIEAQQTEAMEKAAADDQLLTPVKIVEVFTQPLTDRLTLPATIEPYVEIDLASRRPGTIEWIGPKEGDRVVKGEKVLQQDVGGLKARLRELQTAFELAEARFKRQQELYERQVVSIDQLESAEAAVKQTRASLDALEVEIGYGAVYSPIDGVVDEVPVNVGEHVGEGRPIMKIVAVAKVYAVLNVPEKDVLYFEPGKLVEVVLDNETEKRFSGPIEFVAMVADRASRTFPVKVALDNAAGRLRPGMIVRAKAQRRHNEKAIAVPFFVVLDRNRQQSVFVVDDDGVARERRVETGFYQGGQIEVASGLNVGDRLVVVGQRNLFDGEKVAVAADLTEQAKAILERGVDLSALSLEIFK